MPDDLLPSAPRRLGGNFVVSLVPDNQSQLHRNCSELVPPAGLNVSDNDTWCDWVPFGKFPKTAFIPGG